MTFKRLLFGGSVVVCALMAGRALGYPLTGKVTECTETQVVMELDSGEAKVGDSVELLFVTASGIELPVGTLVVGRVEGSTLYATPREGDAPARKGLKVVVRPGSDGAAAGKAAAAKPIKSEGALLKMPTVQTVPAETAVSTELQGTVLSVSGRDITIRLNSEGSLSGGQTVYVRPGPRGSPVAPPRRSRDPEVDGLITKLESLDPLAQREAAQEIRASHGSNTELLDAVKAQLLKGYMDQARDPAHVDAMSWFCRTLGDSGDTRYSGVLETVMRNAPSAKLRKYAAVSYKALQ